VDQRWQGKGLGVALVADAIRRTLQVADIAGVRALLVHAKDNDANNSMPISVLSRFRVSLSFFTAC
jgi:GNAT superfamily N-acetyltransferase